MRDFGNEETERLIRKMEREVAEVYQQAAQEVEAKCKDYFRRFEIKDEIWRQKVESGEKLEKDYKAWREQQMLVGQKWTDLQNQLADEMHRANITAREIVMGYRPEVYVINHAFSTFLAEKVGGIETSYTLFSRETVDRILREQPELLPPPGEQMRQTFAKFDRYKASTEKGVSKAAKKELQSGLSQSEKVRFKKLIDKGKDVRWQKGQIQSVVTQAVAQGESIPNITRRIARTMGEVNHASTIRYARTAMTGAQAAGREDAYRRLADMGVKVKRIWVATVDNRTRHEHRQLDQQKVEIDEPFEVDGMEIMFPGDPACPYGELIWNCRCRTVSEINGHAPDFSRRDLAKIDEGDYDAWKASRKEESHPIDKQERIAAIMRKRYIEDNYS